MHVQAAVSVHGVAACNLSRDLRHNQMLRFSISEDGIPRASQQVRVFQYYPSDTVESHDPICCRCLETC